MKSVRDEVYDRVSGRVEVRVWDWVYVRVWVRAYLWVRDRVSDRVRVEDRVREKLQ